jgi:hypothetical protein
MIKSVCVCMFLCPLLLQADEISFQSLLESAQKPISMEHGKLTGEGAETLLSSANRAQFIALGEGHLNSETPAFIQALLNSVEQGRFAYIGIETGPYSAEFLQDMINGENPEGSMKEFVQQYPKAIPFFDHEGEFNLLRTFPTVNTEPDRIWGLDQEFFFSARFLLDELGKYLETQPAREYVAALKQGADEAYREYETTGSTAPLLLDKLTQAEFDELREQLAAENSQEAENIVDELEASRNIYRAYQEKRYYENNAGRITLFKANFMSNFKTVTAKTGEPPHVLVKMGSYHAGRGLSPVDHFDIGNFLSEFALSLGQQSYHIIVVAPKQLSAGESEDLIEQQPMIGPYAKLLTGKQPVFVDLAKVRKDMRRRILDKLPRDQVRLIYAYDAVIVLPEFTSAAPL